MIELENIFSVVWRTCWQSTVLFATIAILVFVVRDRIAPKWRFLLWGLVLCRLAIVVTPPSPISAFNLLAFERPQASSHENSADDDAIAIAADGVSAVLDKTPPPKPRPNPNNENADQPHPISTTTDEQTASVATPSIAEGTAVPAPRPSRIKWIFVIWLAGFIVSIAYWVAAQLRLRKQINECCPAMDERLLATLDSLSSDFKIRRTPTLLISPRMTSPYACGIWQPTIVLPEYALSTLTHAELRCVLAHELAHIRRHDMLVQWCAMAISSLYWFHPAAWLSAFQMRRCREGACDELVLQRLGDSRLEYGRALLQMADHLRAPVLVPGLCGLFGSRQPIGERIKRITDFQQLSPLANGLAIAVMLATIAIGLTDATAQSLAQTGLESKESKTGNTSISAKAAKDQTLTGQCIRAVDQSPVADARIVLYQRQGLLEEVTKVAETNSDQEGKFEFKNLRPMSDHHFEKHQFVMIAFADGLPHSWANPISLSSGLQNQFIWMNHGPVALRGRVADDQGNPIVGAIVQQSSSVNAEDVGTVMATTDQQGEFSLSGAAVHPPHDGNESSAYLRIRHPDFVDNIFESRPNKHSVFTLKKADCTIAGTVIDAKTSQPVPGTIVSAITFESGQDMFIKVHAKTDGKGRYELKVPQGKYKIVLNDDMHRVAKAQIVQCRAQEKKYELPAIEAQEGGWIVGKVFNTRTNQPLPFCLFGAGVPNMRVCVGLFGPSRPMGNLIQTEHLAEVDDDGSFRMRAYPGENFPYVCNMRSPRSTSTTMKQPAVIVEAGKETRWDISLTPELTAAEKMAAAQKVLDPLPKETDARVAEIIEEFRKLNHTVDECEIWCLLMKELVDIGDPAVPALCKEFEATDEQRMMRRLGFALRAIGDPRAVPTLIRVLPKTLQPPMSDYGLVVENLELASFMRKHQIDGYGGGGGIHFSFGRPVMEHSSALKKLTGHKWADDYTSVSKSKDLRALAKQEKLYYNTARDWADWWEANWKSTGVDEQYSKVNLPPLVPRELGDYPKGLEITENAELEGGVAGQILTPVGDADTSANFFLDLDTGKSLKWPKEKLPTSDASEQIVKQASQWAAANGADLLCTTLEEGTKNYALLGVNMQLWEIDSFDYQSIQKMLAKGELPKGKPMKQPFLLPLGADEASSKIGSSFLYVTRDEGLGVITITDIVTQAKDIRGMFVPKGVGFYRGVKISYWPIAR